MIIFLTIFTFSWTCWIFHEEFLPYVVLTVILIRLISSMMVFNDYSMAWSKSTQKTFMIKSLVYLLAFAVYLPLFYGEIHFELLTSELFLYLFLINFLMYGYYFYINKSRVQKTKSVVIYGAGKAGLKLEEEFRGGEYKLKYFIDDAKRLQKRSVDGIKIISKVKLKALMKDEKFDLLVIAMPSAPALRIKEVYERLHDYFHKIKVLPNMTDILSDQPFTSQLKRITVEDLLARHPQDLDKEKIASFIKNKTVLITGAGGSIGSELVRQCIKFKVKQLILLDHSEYNLYQIEQEVADKADVICVMQSVLDKERLQKTFEKYKPQIVIHAAAYKHVPMVEANMDVGILNNVIGTKNCIDVSLEKHVEKFILISTDKAVRPTNVMGTTKRICELYAQNSNGNGTEIVAVRFGNVLGSSGSVIPKFRSQIKKGQDITVTHPDITRYFMLIPEACELVLQAGAIGKGGEILILDMGEPIKIVDLAKKMIEISGRDDIQITFSGLRPGEKLYEELLIDETNMHTEYDSITVAAPTYYDIRELNEDIDRLVQSDDKLSELKKIVPEFAHRLNN